MTSTTLDTGLLQAARLWIGHHRPYYAAALYRCPIVTNHDIPTMAVDDHWRMYVNPAYANQLSVTRFAAAMIHEVNHLIRDHAARARGLGVQSPDQHRLWNLAGDAELNDDLAADGLDVDAERWIFPWTFKFKPDLTAEVYYRKIRKNLKKAAQCGSGSGGEALPGELPANHGEFPAVSEREAQMVRADVADAVLAHHRSQGNVPGDLVAWARSFLTPKVDWRRVLAGMVREAVATVSDGGDFTYRRFSRRSSALPNIRMPGLLRHVPQVAVVVDTSGSMSQNDLERAVAEVRGILTSASVANDAITVLAVDAAVHEVQQVTRVDTLRMSGRGGTNMVVGLDAALGLKPRPDIIVVLTDGYTPWPENRLPVPVIVGLIVQDHARSAPRPPAWMRCVDIDD